MKEQKHVGANDPVYTQSQKEYLKFGRRHFQRKCQMTMSEEKGITLIALIITIIILLILAMVSIKLVWNGGIINHSKNAVNIYNTAQTNELEQLNIVEEQMKRYTGVNIAQEPTWWKLTETEIQELGGYDEHGELDGTIALSDEKMIEIGPLTKDGYSEMGISVAIWDNNNVNGYMYTHSDSVVNYWQDRHDNCNDEGANNKTDTVFKKYKWYKSIKGSMFGDAVEYTGPSPISLDDFTDEQIYCKSYLKRVIDSFNQ